MIKYLLIPALILCFFKPEISSAIAILSIASVVALEILSSAKKTENSLEINERIKKLENELNALTVSMRMR